MDGGTAIASLVMAVLAASPNPVEIGWTAPMECPSRAQVAASVSGMLAGATAREPVHADVVVVDEGGRWSAEIALRIDGNHSTRTLVATSCSALAEATALVIAVTVDPLRALESSVPEPIATPIPEPPIVEAPPTSPSQVPIDVAVDVREPPPQPPTRRRPGVHLRVLGGADYGATPGLTGMLGGAIGLRGRSWRAEVDGSWGFAREASLRIAPDVRAALGRWSIGARGCGVVTRGRIEVPLCAAIEAGAIEGEGKGETIRAQHERRPWVAAVLGPAVAIAIVPRVALVLGIDLVAPLWRARFVIGDEEVHSPRPLGVRGLFGVELRLGGSP